ncbi:MAG: aldehyde dehydrogenase family protein [Methanomicrobiales archaeon]|nr:aldehyde dehydrogenase family protein [Methanomicrobiales archaeon]
MPGTKVTYVSMEGDPTLHRAYEDALEAATGELGQRHPILIGGREVYTGREFGIRSPIDRDILIGSFQTGGEEEARSAFREAKKAFPEWSRRGFRERAAIIRKTADRLLADRYLLAALITCEVGKNRFEAVAEVGEAVDMLRYNADLYAKNQGYRVPMEPEAPGARGQSVMKPHGAWAVISPFNFPLDLAAGMASAALLTGNTIVMKPTSAAPLSGLKLYRAFVSGGVPAGAINYVTGPGGPFGEAAVSSPDIDGIAFTGSRDAGMWLIRNFSARQPYPKPLIAEMGSKNPVIVTGKADLGKAVEGVVRGAFGYSGQKCSATSRVYVHTSVARMFMESLKKRTEALKLGDPRERDVFLGPVIDEKAMRTFVEAVDLCKKDGGTVITGGRVHDDGPLSKGYYVEPTLVTGLPQGHLLEKRELFVPFLVIDTFSTLDEALGRANDTEYGLTAGIFSEDEAEVEAFFEGIRFGVCYSNRGGGATTGAWAGHQSFGGWKASGSTGKGVGGPYYLLSYLREQAQTSV